jgi:hypothetical protein
MSGNYNQNTNDGNQNYNKRKSLTPTIGEAVKEAIDTGKEVVMEGPTEAGDTTGIKDDTFETHGPERGSKGENKGGVLSLGDGGISKTAKNVKDPSDQSKDSTLDGDEIIVNPVDVKENEEATIAAVTMVPAEGGLDVEVQTELEVPVEDKDKGVESELRVRVHSPTMSKEVPLSPQQQQPPQISPSTLPGINESMSSSFNNQKNQEHSNRNLGEDGDNPQIETGKTGLTPPHSQSIDEAREQSAQLNREIANNYRALQKQFMNSFQSMFVPYFGNINLVWGNQAYLSRLFGIYSRISVICTENAIALNRMARDIAFANIDAFNNIIYNSKEKPE